MYKFAEKEEENYSGLFSNRLQNAAVLGSLGALGGGLFGGGSKKIVYNPQTGQYETQETITWKDRMKNALGYGGALALGGAAIPSIVNFTNSAMNSSGESKKDNSTEASKKNNPTEAPKKNNPTEAPKKNNPPERNGVRLFHEPRILNNDNLTIPDILDTKDSRTTLFPNNTVSPYEKQKITPGVNLSTGKYTTIKSKPKLKSLTTSEAENVPLSPAFDAIKFKNVGDKDRNYDTTFRRPFHM